MKLSDFDFDLPEDLIATRPAQPRSASRLLVARPEEIEEARAIDLPSFIRPGDRLVLNDHYDGSAVCRNTITIGWFGP